MSTTPQTVAVLIGDVIASRKIEGFRQLRDRTLAELSEDHLRLQAVVGNYAVTAGDEFQNLLLQPAQVPSIVWDLRCRFHPLRLRIGIGLGPVESIPKSHEAINVAGEGKAFIHAREALGRVIRRANQKYRYLTAFQSGREELDRPVNLIYRLVDTLLEKTTKRQWETILAFRKTRRVDKAAGELGVNESTVSRNLRRGSYWQIEDVLRTLEWMLEPERPYLHIPVQ